MNTIVDLPFFGKAHKKHASYRPCPPELISKYRGRLPDLLVDSWASHGFQNFSDGFLWSVDPDQYRPLAAGFVHAEQLDDIDVMFRTAFGDMLISHLGRMFHFSALTMESDDVPNVLEALLEYGLSQPSALNSLYFFKLYKQALKRLGPLAEDEVYALVPARPLGGEIALDNLEKANLAVYLDILSQLQSPD